MPKLIVQLQGQEWSAELQAGPNTIGRQSSCTVPIKDTTLSRLHCEILLEGSTATLVDKGSMNGTLLNGKRVATQILKPGDRISIGATTLWFEQKNLATEKTEAPSSRSSKPLSPPPSTRAVRPEGAPPISTRRTAPPPPPKPARSVEPADVAEDYSYFVKGGGGILKVFAAVAVFAALGAAAWFGRGLLPSKSGVTQDLDNLVRNGTFDAAAGGRPDFWTVRPSLTGEKSSCAATVELSRGRDGGPGLLLEKSAGGADLVAECGFQDEIPLGRAGSVEFSAWTQFENFGGSAALKIDWLRGPRGPSVAEEFSDPASKCAAWTRLEGRFSPPPGATACRVALAVVGRGGRVFFDDVSVKVKPGAGAWPPVEKKVGAHRVVSTRQGVLQIDLRGGRRALANVSLRLESEKEGITSQAFATEPSAAADEGGLVVQGRLLSPLDFREVPFEQRVTVVDGFTHVSYQFRGEALRQVDRVTIGVTLPRVEGVRGLSEGEELTPRVTCSTEEGDFALEYPDPVRVKSRTLDGRVRLFQTWIVNAQGEDPVFQFRIREAGAGPLDPLQAHAELVAQRKYGEALAFARETARKSREAQIKEKMEAAVRQLGDQERRDWADLQARAFQARISRRPQKVAEAFEGVDQYLKLWSGEGTEGKAETLRAALEKELAATPDAEAERPRRIFERARKSVEAGRRALAQALLQTLLARYPSSEVAAEAQQLLKTLNQ